MKEAVDGLGITGAIGKRASIAWTQCLERLAEHLAKLLTKEKR